MNDYHLSPTPFFIKSILKVNERLMDEPSKYTPVKFEKNIKQLTPICTRAAVMKLRLL